MALLRVQSQQMPLDFTFQGLYILRLEKKLARGGRALTINTVSTFCLSRLLLGVIPPRLKRTQDLKVASEAFSRLFISGALHPLSMAIVWQQLSPYDTGIIETIAMINNTKSVWDGLPEHLVAEGVYLLTIFLLRKLANRLKVPVPRIENRANHPQVFLQSGLNRLFAMLGYNTIYDYLAKIITFPLTTIRYHMEAQGVNPSLPIIFSNGLQCARFISRKYGIKGFYHGISILFLSAVPETIMFFAVYFSLSAGLRCLPDDPNDETNVYLEENMRKFLTLLGQGQ